MNKKIHIFGGGTMEHITNHFSICAPTYGNVAGQIEKFLVQLTGGRFDIIKHLTKLAGGDLVTSEDVKKRLDEVVKDPLTKIIFFTCGICDWRPVELIVSESPQTIGDWPLRYHLYDFGKNDFRLQTKHVEKIELILKPAEKLIKDIRKTRKDIFLVAFKTTCNSTPQEMYLAGLDLLKNNSCNLVLVNDTKTRRNMVVTPEESAYHDTTKRERSIFGLVDMAVLRSHLTFTQSTVVAGNRVKWSDERVPDSLRKVVDYCRGKNAYKVFNGSTVGHFAIALSETEFLTSIRKTNFNELDEIGLVYVKTDGPDTVLAYGAKPSVGGQSQRIVFKNHFGFDCIVHFHCPLKKIHVDEIPIRSQRNVECGSHECGKNTSDGLKSFEDGKIKAVMLEMHGPNIVFNKNIDPQIVIDFIERNFDLTAKTGGYMV